MFFAVNDLSYVEWKIFIWLYHSSRNTSWVAVHTQGQALWGENKIVTIIKQFSDLARFHPKPCKLSTFSLVTNYPIVEPFFFFSIISSFSKSDLKYNLKGFNRRLENLTFSNIQSNYILMNNDKLICCIEFQWLKIN